MAASSHHRLDFSSPEYCLICNWICFNIELYIRAIHACNAISHRTDLVSRRTSVCPSAWTQSEHLPNPSHTHTLLVSMCGAGEVILLTCLILQHSEPPAEIINGKRKCISNRNDVNEASNRTDTQRVNECNARLTIYFLAVRLLESNGEERNRKKSNLCVFITRTRRPTHYTLRAWSCDESGSGERGT